MNLIGRYQRVSGSENITPRWEQDYHLQPMGKLGLFYEYLEMSKYSVKSAGLCVEAEGICCWTTELFSIFLWVSMFFSNRQNYIAEKNQNFQIRCLCVVLLVFMLFRAKELLPGDEIEFSLRYSFVVSSQSVLTVLSVNEPQSLSLVMIHWA